MKNPRAQRARNLESRDISKRKTTISTENMNQTLQGIFSKK